MQTYDRDLADVFVTQSEIARSIAEQLHVKLSSSEEAAIEKRPTNDLTAFDLYVHAKALQSNAMFNARREENFREAIGLLEQAVARDPSFLLAYCRLARGHDALYFNGFDRTATRRASAAAAVQAALRLAPDSGEAHFALATHLFRGYRDFDHARAELAIARQLLPNDPDVFALAGLMDHHQTRNEDAVRNLERALELDPRDIDFLQLLAVVYEWLRRFPEMEATLDRALAVAPADPLTRVERGLADLFWRADTRRLHTTIESIVVEDPKGVKGIGWHWSLLALCERDSAAIERIHKSDPEDGLTEGLGAWIKGDRERARVAFTVARDEQAKIVKAQPDHAQGVSLLGLMEATLGRKEEALLAGRRAVEMLPANQGEQNIAILAIIAAWVGEKDLAIEQLELAVRRPNSFEVQYGYLKLHPFWDPLRGDPRFEKIVASLAPK
jgi:tetratricopeptide (TPR) repeat protein